MSLSSSKPVPNCPAWTFHLGGLSHLHASPILLYSIVCVICLKTHNGACLSLVPASGAKKENKLRPARGLLPLSAFLDSSTLHHYSQAPSPSAATTRPSLVNGSPFSTPAIISFR